MASVSCMVARLLDILWAWQCTATMLCWGHGPRKNSGSHIDASLSRQPLVKGERLVRYEVNAVMHEPCLGTAVDLAFQSYVPF